MVPGAVVSGAVVSDAGWGTSSVVSWSYCRLPPGTPCVMVDELTRPVWSVMVA